jgi:hypothetical protein
VVVVAVVAVVTEVAEVISEGKVAETGVVSLPNVGLAETGMVISFVVLMIYWSLSLSMSMSMWELKQSD